MAMLDLFFLRSSHTSFSNLLLFVFFTSWLLKARYLSQPIQLQALSCLSRWAGGSNQSFVGWMYHSLAIQDSQMVEKIKKHRKDPIQKRTQNQKWQKKNWGCLGLLFHPKINVFLYSSFNIEVMGKDNTFMRVIILAHQESGGFWWSEVLL